MQMPQVAFRPALRHSLRALVACGLLIAGATAGLAEERQVPASRAQLQLSFSPIVKQTAPAVVNVYVRRRVRTFNSPFAGDPFFERFFGRGRGAPRERMENSLGSGVIVSAEGIVVTNAHVIKGSGEAEVKVALADKREFDAIVISSDEETDIAILKIDAPGVSFQALEFHDSDAIEVGDLVLAIGNPFGVGQTVTSGIVSALARTRVGRGDGQFFIQTDAAINPGNSGGALVDMSGRLIGINTAIFTRSGGSHGIGFAIPANLVRPYVDSAISGRQVERPWFGAQLADMTRDLATALGLSRVSGAIVNQVYPDSPAEAAGIAVGDVIQTVDGREVDDPRAVIYRLTTRGVGNVSLIGVIRDGRETELSVELRPAPKVEAVELSGAHPFDGAKVADLTPWLADELNLSETSGVVITDVPRTSYAARLGLRPGDMIVGIDNRRIDGLAELERVIQRARRAWPIQIKRGRRIMQMVVPG